MVCKSAIAVQLRRYCLGALRRLVPDRYFPDFVVGVGLADTQERLRNVSDRAIAHLQRSIAVDEALREKWKTAFDHHETACEKLGAVHLLLHSI